MNVIGRDGACLRRKGETGFTLVELMVALFIFGMLAAAGTVLLAFSVRSQSAATARLDALASDARMSTLLAADFAQAVPRIVRDEAGADVPAFFGSNGVGADPLLRYTRAGWTNASDAPRASIQRVEILLAEGRLERRTRAMADGAPPGPVTILATRVEGVRVRYRDRNGWRDRWAEARTDAMPRAVELIVRRAGQPPLLMAFLVGTGA